MATPQPGIFVEGTAHHHFLEYALAADEDADTVRGALAAAVAPAPAGVSCVLAFGAEAWRRLAPDALPDGLRPFDPIAGADGTSAPASQRDILVWLHGGGRDDLLDGALAAHRALAPVSRLGLELTGFTYHDARDLTGFIDGTANPRDDAAREAALLPEGAPGAGGAFVLTQKWLHDLEAFGALAVAEQERVIGRTKPDSVELTGAAMPPDSHVARPDISVDGEPMKIYRRSAPFGGVAEHGLYFIAFACGIRRFDALLAHMFGTAEDGVRDRLTAFSTPMTGAYWLAPSQEDLRTACGLRPAN